MVSLGLRLHLVASLGFGRPTVASEQALVRGRQAPSFLKSCIHTLTLAMCGVAYNCLSYSFGQKISIGNLMRAAEKGRAFLSHPVLVEYLDVNCIHLVSFGLICVRQPIGPCRETARARAGIATVFEP
jgi:hypothetical protein